MTLTADEITDIRLVCGLQDTTAISSTVIQAQYDLAVADAPDSDLILPYTYVYLLRRAWGFQRLKPTRTTTHGDRQERIQIKDTSKELLDYWEGVAGLSGVGILAFGTIDLDLDEDDETE